MEILLPILILILAATAPWWGTDSRDGRDWQARGDWQAREEGSRARAQANQPSR